MGLFSAFSKLTAVTKADIRQVIADEKCKLIDAKSRGDKEAVAKIQKEIEQLKARMAKAPTKQYKQRLSAKQALIRFRKACLAINSNVGELTSITKELKISLSDLDEKMRIVENVIMPIKKSVEEFLQTSIEYQNSF